MTWVPVPFKPTVHVPSEQFILHDYRQVSEAPIEAYANDDGSDHLSQEEDSLIIIGGV